MPTHFGVTGIHGRNLLRSLQCGTIAARIEVLGSIVKRIRFQWLRHDGVLIERQAVDQFGDIRQSYQEDELLEGPLASLAKYYGKNSSYLRSLMAYAKSLKHAGGDP